MADFFFLGSIITEDGDFSHAIKRRLLLGRKVMTNLDSILGEGDGTPLQYSCLENPMGGGAWWAVVHGVAGSRTRLSNFTFTFHSHASIQHTPLHYSCLENPMGGRAWWAAVYGVVKSRTRLSDFTSVFTFMHRRRKWQPTPVFLPGESQGWGSLVGCCLWGLTESDTTEAT